jgi:hypothetical protein
MCVLVFCSKNTPRVVISVEEETHEETETQAPQDEAKIEVGDVRPCEKFADHFIQGWPQIYCTDVRSLLLSRSDMEM